MIIGSNSRSAMDSANSNDQNVSGTPELELPSANRPSLANSQLHRTDNKRISQLPPITSFEDDGISYSLNSESSLDSNTKAKLKSILDRLIGIDNRLKESLRF